MIGNELKALRQSNGYKQQYVADKLGISQTHVCRIENGDVYPSLEVLEMFATFYGKGSVENAIINVFM